MEQLLDQQCGVAYIYTRWGRPSLTQRPHSPECNRKLSLLTYRKLVNTLQCCPVDLLVDWPSDTITHERRKISNERWPRNWPWQTLQGSCFQRKKVKSQFQWLTVCFLYYIAKVTNFSILLFLIKSLSPWEIEINISNIKITQGSNWLNTWTLDTDQTQQANLS